MPKITITDDDGRITEITKDTGLTLKELRELLSANEDTGDYQKILIDGWWAKSIRAGDAWVSVDSDQSECRCENCHWYNSRYECTNPNTPIDNGQYVADSFCCNQWCGVKKDE